MSETETTTTETEEVEQPNYALLAQQHFGNRYHGEVTEPVETPKSDENPFEDETDDVQEAPEAEEQREEDSEDATEDPAETEAETLTFDDLTEHFKESGVELDEGWYENLSIKGQVNGEERTYTLKDLKAAMQKADAADDILNRAKEKSREQAEQVKQQAENIEQAAFVFADLLKSDFDALQKEYESADFDSMESGDRAAAELDFQKRFQRLQARRKQASEAYQQYLDQKNNATTSTKAEQLEVEQQRLLDKIPEWSDNAKAAEEKKAVAEYLMAQDFSQEELTDLSDHRLIVLARKARLYDEGKAKGEVAEKKVKRLPKILKPGTQKTGGQVLKDDVDKLRRKLQNTKGRDSYAIAVELARKSR